VGGKDALEGLLSAAGGWKLGESLPEDRKGGAQLLLSDSYRKESTGEGASERN